MTYEPIAAHLAVELARLSAGSARPDAPVVPDAATLGPARHAPDSRWPAACAPSPAGSSPARPRWPARVERLTGWGDPG